jgi:hypothetical protein
MGELHTRLIREVMEPLNVCWVLMTFGQNGQLVLLLGFGVAWAVALAAKFAVEEATEEA